MDMCGAWEHATARDRGREPAQGVFEFVKRRPWIARIVRALAGLVGACGLWSSFSSAHERPHDRPLENAAGQPLAAGHEPAPGSAELGTTTLERAPRSALVPLDDEGWAALDAYV